MRPQQVLVGFTALPRVAVADGASVAASLVRVLHTRDIVLGQLQRCRRLCCCHVYVCGSGGHATQLARRHARGTHRRWRRRTSDEEGVMGVTSRVGLGLEQGIKVPERRLHEASSGHLLKAAPTRRRVVSVKARHHVCVHSGKRYPISSRMLRNSARTLSSGCRWPPGAGLPQASKLKGLNSTVFHLSLCECGAAACAYELMRSRHSGPRASAVHRLVPFQHV